MHCVCTLQCVFFCVTHSLFFWHLFSGMFVLHVFAQIILGKHQPTKTTLHRGICWWARSAALSKRFQADALFSERSAFHNCNFAPLICWYVNLAWTLWGSRGNWGKEREVNNKKERNNCYPRIAVRNFWTSVRNFWGWGGWVGQGIFLTKLGMRIQLFVSASPLLQSQK